MSFSEPSLLTHFQGREQFYLKRLFYKKECAGPENRMPAHSLCEDSEGGGVRMSEGIRSADLTSVKERLHVVLMRDRY